MQLFSLALHVKLSHYGRRLAHVHLSYSHVPTPMKSKAPVHRNRTQTLGRPVHQVQ